MNSLKEADGWKGISAEAYSSQEGVNHQSLQEVNAFVNRNPSRVNAHHEIASNGG
jgi:hypothetical protein